MLFSQILQEYEWLNLNPRCVFIFCERPYEYKRYREKLEEEYLGYHFIFLPIPVDLDFEDNQVHHSFFMQNIVARVFPRYGSDFTFLAEGEKPYSREALSLFMEHLNYRNKENRRQHFARFGEDLPFEEEIDELLQEEGVWSIEDSITYVKSFINKSTEREYRQRGRRYLEPTYSYGFLRLERVRVEDYGRKDSVDGWYRLMFRRVKDTSRETDIKFSTALSKVLYLFMLRHTGDRFQYSDMPHYQDEIYGIAQALYYGKKDENAIRSIVRSLTCFSGSYADITNTNLTESKKHIRKAFHTSIHDDGSYYEIQDDWSEGHSVRSRYLNVPKDHIDSDIDFDELVNRYKKEYQGCEPIYGRALK